MTPPARLAGVMPDGKATWEHTASSLGRSAKRLVGLGKPYLIRSASESFFGLGSGRVMGALSRQNLTVLPPR